MVARVTLLVFLSRRSATRLGPICNQSAANAGGGTEYSLRVREILSEADDYSSVGGRVVGFLDFAVVFADPDDGFRIVEDEAVEDQVMLKLAVDRLESTECHLMRANIHREPTAAIRLGNKLKVQAP